MTRQPTPYDTGDRMEPRPWISDRTADAIRRGRAQLDADRFGRVDFDNDAGATIATVYIERTADGHTLHVEYHGAPDGLEIIAHRTPSAERAY